ncbi:MAG: NAD-dependent epimerase/dehydratase family protein [Ruminococcus sp.]|nr:NAD-dependent epimerase/dehydratase family protein [Ruminococcus sp.]
MRLLNNELYRNDVSSAASCNIDWSKLKDSSIVISGATGLIGSFLIDVIMCRNSKNDLNCRIIALGRNKSKAAERFAEYMEHPLFRFVECDICSIDDIDIDGDLDYFFHAASNTHPVAYATDPIGTITVNVIGLKNMLEIARKHNSKRFLFASSNEIYGENRGDTDKFKEDYCGYINCNTLRAGYPESKRVSEALCQAYIKQYDMDIVIPRLTRSFGATLLSSDTKALSQFLKKGVNGEDIILKSAGSQLYSFTYVADAVTGVLFCLANGNKGEAYNIATSSCDITLRELAQTIADYVGTKVIFEIPDSTEAAGYSVVTKALLDGSKIEALGWKSDYDINKGIAHTIDILKMMED